MNALDKLGKPKSNGKKFLTGQKQRYSFGIMNTDISGKDLQPVIVVYQCQQFQASYLALTTTHTSNRCITSNQPPTHRIGGFNIAYRQCRYSARPTGGAVYAVYTSVILPTAACIAL
jgi:hypothetical protein